MRDDVLKHLEAPKNEVHGGAALVIQTAQRRHAPRAPALTRTLSLALALALSSALALRSTLALALALRPHPHPKRSPHPKRRPRQARGDALHGRSQLPQG